MSEIMWDKPEKVMSREEYESISADGAPPGVYQPNMSEEDRLKWRGKLIVTGTNDPRVELRKGFGSVNAVWVVRDSGVIQSANGKLRLSWEDVHDIYHTLARAIFALARALDIERLKDDND